jgi:hypothetical protein
MSPPSVIAADALVNETSATWNKFQIKYYLRINAIIQIYSYIYVQEEFLLYSPWIFEDSFTFHLIYWRAVHYLWEVWFLHTRHVWFLQMFWFFSLDPTLSQT